MKLPQSQLLSRAGNANAQLIATKTNKKLLTLDPIILIFGLLNEEQSQIHNLIKF